MNGGVGVPAAGDDAPVVLVTGGIRGIGEAISEGFGEIGATVIRTGRGAAAPEGNIGEGSAWHYCSLDVTDRSSIAAAMDRIRERWGRIDVLVNNAGATTAGRIAHDDLEGISQDDWHLILDTNVIGTWNVITAAAPLLRAAASPLILNVSSFAGAGISGSSVAYAVSKAGVDHMTRLLAAALAPQIRVNAVAPGMTDSPHTSGWGTVRDNYAKRNPLQRIAQPRDISDVCVGLYRSEFVTGLVIPVDGGRHLGAL